jgi:cytohesin
MNRILQLAILLLAASVLIGVAGCSQKDALHDAARNGDLAKVKTLLATHPDLVNRKDTNGMTPLHCAALGGHKDIAELLLAKQADVNAKDNAGISPLSFAAGSGYKDVVQLLLAKQADVNARSNDGWTPLHAAAMSGHKDVAELLLAKQADVNARNNKGETPLRMVLALATDSRYTPATELGKRNQDMAEWLRQHGGHE